MKLQVDPVDFTLKQIFKATLDKKLYLIANLKDQINQISNQSTVDKITVYKSIHQGFIDHYNIGIEPIDNISFIKKFFKVKSKNNNNFFDNLFYDGIDKRNITKLLSDVNKLLNLINLDLVKNVPKIDLFITQKNVDSAYSIAEENAIVVEFVSFDQSFLAIQIFHEFVHFIEIYNEDVNKLNLQYINDNMKSVEVVNSGNSQGYSYDIGAVDKYSGFVYSDNRTELLSNELMFFLKNPVDSLILNTKFYNYINSIKFFA